MRREIRGVSHDHHEYEYKRSRGGGTKAKYMRNIMANDSVEVVCLQESKSVEFSDTRCFSLWGEQ